MVFSEKHKAATESKYEKRGIQIWSANKLWKEHLVLLMSSVKTGTKVSENRQYEKGKRVELVSNNDKGGERNGN